MHTSFIHKELNVSELLACVIYEPLSERNKREREEREENSLPSKVVGRVQGKLGALPNTCISPCCQSPSRIKCRTKSSSSY